MGGIMVAYLWLLGCLVVYLWLFMLGEQRWKHIWSIYGAVMELFVEQQVMHRMPRISLSISSRLARLDWQGLETP